MPEESDSSEKSAEIPSSVPEIYFDIIARVVPGAIAIGLYSFGPNLHEFNTPTIGFVALICSYFLGMILHIVSDRLWDWGFYSWQPSAAECCSFFHLYKDADLWRWIRLSLGPTDRNVFTKMMAEKAMFRSTSLIAIASAFYPPIILHSVYPGSAWHIAIPSFLLLAYSMIMVAKWISCNKKEYDRLAGLKEKAQSR